jgi:hypothetical protein
MVKQANSPSSRNDDRQIVGFSLSRDLATEVKMEAARRNVSLKNLFAEIWAIYKNNSKKGA